MGGLVCGRRAVAALHPSPGPSLSRRANRAFQASCRRGPRLQLGPGRRASGVGRRNGDHRDAVSRDRSHLRGTWFSRRRALSHPLRDDDDRARARSLSRVAKDAQRALRERRRRWLRDGLPDLRRYRDHALSHLRAGDRHRRAVGRRPHRRHHRPLRAQYTGPPRLRVRGRGLRDLHPSDARRLWARDRARRPVHRAPRGIDLARLGRRVERVRRGLVRLPRRQPPAIRWRLRRRLRKQPVGSASQPADPLGAPVHQGRPHVGGDQRDVRDRVRHATR
jgi:hypothetical protein